MIQKGIERGYWAAYFVVVYALICVLIRASIRAAMYPIKNTATNAVCRPVRILFLALSAMLPLAVFAQENPHLMQNPQAQPSGATPVTCEDFQLTQIYADDELLSVNALKVGKYFWSHSLDSYYVNGRMMLPVSQIADIVGMTLRRSGNEIDFAHPDSSCAFTVELQERPFSNGNIPRADLNGYWTQDQFDTYVDIRFLEQLTGAAAQISLAEQLIVLDTASAIKPISAQKSVPKTTFSSVEPEYQVADQYHLSTFPSVDLNLSYSFDDESSTSDYDARLNAYFDTFFQATELRLNHNDTSNTQRLKFSREFRVGAPQESVDKIGYEFGDIFTTQDNLVTSVNLGEGVYFYTGERNQFNAFNEISIQETVSPNWRGELYRNGQFVAAQNANNENQLVFNSVPAFFGFNRYELRLFGPDGQQETRIKTYQMGREQLVENKLDIELYHVRPGNNFIDDDSQTQSFEQASKLGVSYGFSQDLTAGLSVQSLRSANADENDEYVTASLYKQYGPGAFNLEVSGQRDQGFALFGGYSGYWMEQYNVSLDVTHYDDFTSQIRPESSDVRSQIRGRIAGASELWGGFGWSGVLTQQFNETEDDNFQALFSATKNVAGGALSASINYNERDGIDRTFNNLYWVQNFKFATVSVGLNWFPFDDFDIRSSNLEARWNSQNRLFQISRLTYQPDSEARYSLNHQLNWRTRNFTLSSGVTVNDEGEWEFRAGFVTSIGYDYVGNTPRFSHKRSSNTGNLHLLAFLDRDRNGQLTQGDAALQNVKFAGNSDWRFTETNEFGQALLMGASAGGTQQIGIDLASLKDPFLFPQYDKLAVKTHPGGLNRIMIPVVSYSDIEGSVYIEDGMGTRPALNIPVLLKRNKQIIANTRTESDGYFAFSKVSPGKYKIGIDEDYLADKRIQVLDDEPRVEVQEIGDVIWLEDIVLKRDDTANANRREKQTLDQTPSQANLPPAQPLQAKPLQEQGFWIQLGAFKQLASLNNIVKNLSEPAKARLSKVQDKSGTWFLVKGAENSKRIGTNQAFDTKRDALASVQTAKQNNSNTLAAKGWVVPASKFKQALIQPLSRVLTEEAAKTNSNSNPNSNQRPAQRLLQNGEYVCQLGVYRQFSQLPANTAQQFQQTPNALLVDKVVNGQPVQVALLTFAEPIFRATSAGVNGEFSTEFNDQKAQCEGRNHALTGQAGWYRSWSG